MKKSGSRNYPRESTKLKSSKVQRWLTRRCKRRRLRRQNMLLFLVQLLCSCKCCLCSAARPSLGVESKQGDNMVLSPLSLGEIVSSPLRLRVAITTLRSARDGSEQLQHRAARPCEQELRYELRATCFYSIPGTSAMYYRKMIHLG
jgi:hypothetical protein